MANVERATVMHKITQLTHIAVELRKTRAAILDKRVKDGQLGTLPAEDRYAFAQAGSLWSAINHIERAIEDLIDYRETLP